MKKFVNKGILKVVMTMALTVGMIAGVLTAGTQTAYAKDPYTYTVLIHAGNAGTFTQSSTGYVSASGATVTLVDSKTIKVTGLTANSRVNLDFAQVGAVTTSGDNAKYASVGIRQSGHNDLSMTNVAVTKDSSYNIAYGIAANTVQYTVRYVDESGAEVHAAATYRGNVNDTVTVGAQYVENMQPDYWNKGHTLTANESDNVITFVYKSSQSAQPSGGTNTVYETVTVPGDTVYVNGGTTTTGTATGTAGNTAAAAGDAEAAGGEEAAADEGAAAEAAVEEPGEYTNIDDEEVPLADTDLSEDESNTETKSGPGVTLYAGIIAVIIIIGAGIALAKKRSR